MGRRRFRRRPGALSVLWALGVVTACPLCGAFVLPGGGSATMNVARQRPMTNSKRRTTSSLLHPHVMDSVIVPQHSPWEPIQNQRHGQRRRWGLQESSRDDDWELDVDDGAPREFRSENRAAQQHDDDARIQTRTIDPGTTSSQSHGSPVENRSFDKDPGSDEQRTALVNDGGFMDDDHDRRKGLLVLLTVPLAWGTFEPAVRYVYREVPDPIPPFVFSLLYYAVAATTLSLLALSASQGAGSSNSCVATAKTYGSITTNVPSANDSEWPYRGGFELGTYLFVGNALQLLGLQTIASDRAAFLLQLTTIFVPLVEAALVRSWKAVSLRVWAACLLALLGVFVMGLDGLGGRDISESMSVIPTVDAWIHAAPSASWGDLYVVGAAIAYTFHCIRLEPYAQATSAVKLAACKATTEAMWTVTSVVGFVAYYLISATAPSATNDSVNALSLFALNSGRDIVAYVESAWNGFVELSQRGDAEPLGTALSTRIVPAAAAVLWTGWVTVAYTIYAQSYGQRRVRPVTANLIYTIQPICTALVAWLVLGETLGPAGYAGGTLIGAAVLLVTTSTSPTTTSQAAGEKESGVYDQDS